MSSFEARGDLLMSFFLATTVFDSEHRGDHWEPLFVRRHAELQRYQSAIDLEASPSCLRLISRSRSSIQLLCGVFPPSKPGVFTL